MFVRADGSESFTRGLKPQCTHGPSPYWHPHPYPIAPSLPSWEGFWQPATQQLLLLSTPSRGLNLSTERSGVQGPQESVTACTYHVSIPVPRGAWHYITDQKYQNRWRKIHGPQKERKAFFLLFERGAQHLHFVVMVLGRWTIVPSHRKRSPARNVILVEHEYKSSKLLSGIPARWMGR